MENNSRVLRYYGPLLVRATSAIESVQADLARVGSIAQDVMRTKSFCVEFFHIVLSYIRGAVSHNTYNWYQRV